MSELYTCWSCGGVGNKFSKSYQVCGLCNGSGVTSLRFSWYPPTVTVQQGDCLYTIAQRIYGKGEKWPLIYLHNKDKVSHPNHMNAGTILSIPNVNFFRIRPYIVIVKQGDTLSLIAKKVYWNGKKWWDIYDANKYQLSNANEHEQLVQGLCLIIP